LRLLAVVVLAVLCLPGAASASPAFDAAAAARSAGFGPLAERAARAARPRVRVGRVAIKLPRVLGTSRLGGPPDLPVGTRWPSCRGRPQTFLGQLRVRDLPASAGSLRRAGGRLWVFTHVEFETADTVYGLWAGECTRVIHAPIGTQLRRTPRPRLTMRLRPASLRYRVATDIPDVGITDRLSSPLQDVVLPAERPEAWWQMRARLNGDEPYDRRDPVWGEGGHRLLGYVDAPNGAESPCWNLTQKVAAPWRHLLTIGTDSVLGFEVADDGRLQLAISPRDLARGRFDRVCGIFDSA